MKKSTTSGKQKSQQAPQQPVSPSKKPYGFCCEPRRDEPLTNSRPENDPSLACVVLEAGGPNFRVRLEELDRVQSAPKRLATARSRSPRAAL